MSFNTAMLDFSVAPEVVTNPVECQTLHQRVEEVLKEVVPGMTRLIEDLTPSRGFLLNYSADNETFVTLRGHFSGLISIQIENFGDQFFMENEQVLELEQKLRTKLGARRGKAILPLRRGCDVDRFFYSSDERLLEYNVLKTLFDETTPYQRVQIIQTKEFGNALVLDGYVNIAESDQVYTTTLMSGESYEGKTALILGGGDGGLLHELLKQNPKFVTMVEIDDVVMRECREHLRTVCGDSLDKYDGDNYKVIVGDAFEYLKESLSDGRTFDYIFYDLTDIPVTPDHSHAVWKMVKTVMNDCMKLLKSGGKYMTHVTGVNSEVGLAAFEKVVDDLPVKTTRTRSQAWVPSFLENWVFFQITKC